MAVEWESMAGQLVGSLGGAWIIAKKLVAMYEKKDAEHIDAMKGQVDLIQRHAESCQEQNTILMDEVLKLKDKVK